MSPIPSSGEADLRRIDDEFLDLICADVDLLRAEFDAIIDATWSPPPANPPDSPSRADQPGRPDPAQPGAAATHDITNAGVQPCRGIGSARQRSPPRGGRQHRTNPERRERDIQGTAPTVTKVTPNYPVRSSVGMGLEGSGPSRPSIRSAALAR